MENELAVKYSACGVLMSIRASHPSQDVSQFEILRYLIEDDENLSDTTKSTLIANQAEVLKKILESRLTKHSQV